MNCIIIDDDAAARYILSNLCKKIKYLKIEKEFDSAIKAFQFLKTNKVDFILLDVHMPKLNGYEFINKLNNPPKIILTTIDRESAIKAFEYKCIVDYLGKPFKFSRLVKAIEKVARIIAISKNLEKENPTTSNYKNNHLFIKINRSLIKIPLSDICFLKAHNKGVEIHTENEVLIARYSLVKISEKLPESMFFKVSQSSVINISKIANIQNGNVLVNGFTIPVSRLYKSELMKRINIC